MEFFLNVFSEFSDKNSYFSDFSDFLNSLNSIKDLLHLGTSPIALIVLNAFHPNENPYRAQLCVTQ